MDYISTRGGGDARLGFQDAVLAGLASDSGLLIPAAIPDVRDELTRWRSLSYRELAFEVIRRYADIPEDDLRTLMEKSYSGFRHPEITPVQPVGDHYILELFHGPTLAFKDVALQLLGNLFEYILERRGGELNVLAATSGDTGSAAIYSVRGKDRIQIFVMHPYQRVAPVQEKQMTTVLDANVHNIAVHGTFDDCQAIMKDTFGDLAFKKKYSLGAMNSVNWARVLAQIVYYFYAAFRVMDREQCEQVSFSVPTGNFGDILAGYYAARMGLPVNKLILATNENDILSRFFNSGRYEIGDVSSTLSPSMDIQVASNFERYLYYVYGEDPQRVADAMAHFAAHKKLEVPLQGDTVDPLFTAGAGNREATLNTIKETYEQHEYLLDPHTAVGVSVAAASGVADPVICLATAHPAKFGRAVKEATGQDLAHHPVLDGILEAESRCVELPADQQQIQQYIADTLGD